MSNPISSFYWLCAIFCFGLIISCSNADDEYPAATPGDLKTLERLADAYRQLSNQLEAPPLQLRPQVRKKFLVRVFNKVGYSYHKTLIELGNSDVSIISKNHRDLAQLLRLPHYGQADSVKSELYSDAELAAINKMEKW